MRCVRSSQNGDIRQIADVLDVAFVRKLDYHAQSFVNVVECVIEHKVVLCCSQTPKLHCSFLFSFSFLFLPNFLGLANILYIFPEILVKMEQLKFIETDSMPING